MKYADARQEAERLLESCPRVVVYVTATGEWHSTTYAEWLHDKECDALGLAWDSECDVEYNGRLLATAAAFLENVQRQANGDKEVLEW